MEDLEQLDKNILWKSLLNKTIKLAIWSSIIYVLFQIGLHNYLLFHTGIELYTIIVALVVFALVINSYDLVENSFLFFLGIAFGAAAILNILHTFTFNEIDIFNIKDINISMQFSIAARYLESLSLLIAFIVYKIYRLRFRNYMIVTGYSLFAGGIIASILYFRIFPECFIEGKGITDFKIISEYIIAFIYAVSIVSLVISRKRMRSKLYRNILIYMLTTVISGLILAFHEDVSLNGAIVGYLFKLIAYYFFYHIIIVDALKKSIAQMFYELERVKQELGEKNLKILHSNEQLKQDVADLQMIEKLLRKSKAWSRAIFEGSSIGIVLLNVNGVIIEANPAFERILGYNSEELRDLGIQNITHPDEYEGDLKLFNELVEGHIDSYEIEKRYVRKDNTIIWANLKMSYIQNTGEDFQFIIAMVEDITQKKLDEQKQLQLLKELEVTNQELDDFAYIVSHDLKAPLRGIGSLASWLINDYQSKLDNEGKEIINLMINRVERMKNFIEGILQYSRVSRITETKTELDLNKLVEEVIEFITLPENISIVIENELPKVSGYKLYMEQVFQNLISNSVKFMDKPKGLIKIASIEENEHWRISVSDNGSGIDEKYFIKIFQIFQTLQPRDKFESTGIGLSIVKKIIETCGGSIWVESELGKGSTFYFTLPKK